MRIPGGLQLALEKGERGLSRITDRFGTISRAAAIESGCEVLPASAWLEQHVDVLIPSALEAQIATPNVARIHNEPLLGSCRRAPQNRFAAAKRLSGTLRTRGARAHEPADAASLIAVDRVARACRERGWV